MECEKYDEDGGVPSEWASGTFDASYSPGLQPQNVSLAGAEQHRPSPATEAPTQQFKDVTEWLAHHDLGEYSESFEDNAIDLQTIADGLDDADLKELGVVKLGHRKKLIKLMAGMH